MTNYVIKNHALFVWLCFANIQNREQQLLSLNSLHVSCIFNVFRIIKVNEVVQSNIIRYTFKLIF